MKFKYDIEICKKNCKKKVKNLLVGEMHFEM